MLDPTSQEAPASQPTSPWQSKPWWCQPWSILLTGILLIAGSWLVLHRIWVTVLVAIPVGSWMGFFLVLWPNLIMSQMVLHTDEDGDAESSV